MSEVNQKQIFKNQELIRKYPWLKLDNVNDASITWIDFIPDGWRKKFGLKMVKELDKTLKKISKKTTFDYDPTTYHIDDIKEKWGELDWIDSNIPWNGTKLDDSYVRCMEKYIDLSKHTCIYCGRKAKIINFFGWYEPICKKCQKKVKNDMQIPNHKG